MNLNLLGYLIYFPAMAFIAMQVARLCHRNGKLWMLRIFNDDARFVDAVNNILLAACYTLNVGYIALTITDWPAITSAVQLLGALSAHIAAILLVLAWLHYQNIAVLLIWSRIKQRQSTSKGAT